MIIWPWTESFEGWHAHSAVAVNDSDDDDDENGDNHDDELEPQHGWHEWEQPWWRHQNLETGDTAKSLTTHTVAVDDKIHGPGAPKWVDNPGQDGPDY